MTYSDPVVSLGRRLLSWPLTGFGLILIAAAAYYGLWWPAIIVGFILGLAAFSGRQAFGQAAISGVGGWALALLAVALGGSLWSTASTVGGIMGLGGAAPVLILTLLLGGILTLAGAWLGVALRALLLARFGDPFGQF